MDTNRLILVTDDAASVAGAAAAKAVVNHWPTVSRPALSQARAADILTDASPLTNQDAAWVVVDQSKTHELFELVCLLQDLHLPVMLTRVGETQPLGAIHQDGVVICPLGTAPTATRIMLQSLFSQSPVMRSLEAEVKMMRVNEGGLCDQIGRIDEELRLASQLQREFLPKSLPSIGPVAFGVLFRPASYVSGDIYDVIRLDEAHIGFFIADAVGHGVPAALLTMFIKRALRTKKIDPGDPRGYCLVEPNEALEKLNHDMLSVQGKTVRFATACYGVIDCRTLEMCVARAGHPFPIVLRSDERTQTLEPEGGLMGVFEEEKYESMHVQLEPGDRLLLYSDGFETAFPGSDDDDAAQGEESAAARRIATTQYVREFEDLRQGPIEQAFHRLENKLDAQVGSLNQRDDLTILCLDVQADAAPAAGYEAAARVAQPEAPVLAMNPA